MAPWLSLLALLGAEPTAAAADPDRVVAPKIEPVRAWSTDMTDPAGLTRFHLRTTASFADATDALSGSTTWSYEARGHVRLTRGVALSAVIPIGMTTRVDAAGVFGNIGVGLSVGGTVFEQESLLVRLAGAFDTHLPTSSGDREVRGVGLSVAALRASEPQLYLPASLSFRGRFLGEVSVGELAAAIELGLSPSVSFAEDAQGVALLFGGAGRVSYRVLPALEPFLELSATTQIAGVGEIAPPLMLSPGLRLHLADAFDPAFFVSINFVAAHAVMFGVDLAAVIRPGLETKARRARERDGFFD